MEEMIRVSLLRELQDSGLVCLRHRGVPYCVVCFGDQTRAFISICSHEDKIFAPEMKDACLVCPYHNVSFEAASGKVRDSNGKRVPTGLHAVETFTSDASVYLVAKEQHRILMAESEARRAKRLAKKRRRGWLSFLGLRRKK